MTIAVGIFTHDAVLLAADTEVTYGDYMKTEQGKIRGAVHIGADGVREFLLVGSGDSLYIDAFAQALERTIKDRHFANFDARDGIGEVLHDFYERHIVALGLSAQERPCFDLLIAYGTPGERTRLFRTANNVVYEHDHQFGAIGVGTAPAAHMLGRLLGHRRVSLTEAAFLAAYVLFHVKATVPGCGKRTHMFALRGAALISVVPPDQEKLDAAIQRYSEELEPLIFRAAAGSEEVSSASNEMQSIRDIFDDVAKALKVLKEAPRS
jgi:hypothetical protein